jgi:hypothetical protein
MNTRFVSAIFLTGLSILSNCTKDEDEPIHAPFNISGITPQSGPEGTLVLISGKGFLPEAEDNIVKFNGVEAVVQLNSTTEIAATVPPGATTGTVTVTTGGKTATGSVFTVIENPQQVTKTYFIKFKAEGKVKVLEDGNPGYQSCGQCACSYLPALSDSRYAGVDICNDSPYWINAAHIQSWNGKKILFSGNFPLASVHFKENGVYYSSENVLDQSGSEVNVTSVVADGDLFGKKGFKVSGNFKCKVASDYGETPISITEGTFVVRYSED